MDPPSFSKSFQMSKTGTMIWWAMEPDLAWWSSTYWASASPGFLKILCPQADAQRSPQSWGSISRYTQIGRISIYGLHRRDRIPAACLHAWPLSKVISSVSWSASLTQSHWSGWWVWLPYPPTCTETHSPLFSSLSRTAGTDPPSCPFWSRKPP